MAYFIPSSWQKRLLRYALSRLELLDTDALDLESLQIGWGRKSTVELRDVSLKKENLARLLHLPDHLVIETANIGVLRLTVPADLHTSSIVVELTQISSRVRLLDRDTPPTFVDETSESSVTSSSPTTRKATTNLDRSQGKVEDMEVLPTPRDLATSFLLQEPEEEKAQLEAEIGSKSVDLRQSVASSDTGDDDSSQGTGLGLALPTFLAGFLKSVGDRLKVSVRDVSIQLEFELDSLPEDPPSEEKRSGSCAMAVKLRADVVDVEGITTDTKSTADPPENLSAYFGRRMVAIHGLEATLLSYTTSGQQLSEILLQKEFAPSSPTSQTSSPVFHTDSMSETSKNITNQTRPNDDMTASFASASTDSRFADADDDIPEGHHATPMHASQYNEPPFASYNDYDDGDLDFFARQRGRFGNLRDSLLEQDRSNQMQKSDHNLPFRPTQLRQNSFQYEQNGSSRSLTPSPERMRRRPIMRDQETRVPGGYGYDSTTFTPEFLSNDGPDDATDDPDQGLSQSSTPGEDLTESRYFTQTDAQSIYMSVYEDDKSKKSQDLTMPGGWATSVHPDASSPTDRTRTVDEEGREVPEQPKVNDQHEEGTEKYERPGTPVSAVRSSPGDPFTGPHVSRKNIAQLRLVRVWLPHVSDPDSPMDAVSFNTKATESSTKASDINRFDGDIEAVCVAIDPTLMKLAIQLIKKFQPSPTEVKSTPGKKTQNERIDWTLKLHTVVLSLHDRLDDRLNLIKSSNILSESATDSPELQANMNNVVIGVEGNVTTADVGKLILRFQGESLLSFDKSATMRSSIRDLQEPLASDVSLKLKRQASATELHLSTLPIRLMVDLPRLDDALSSLGGFSGLLELGQSVISDTGSKKPQPRQRTVRFDTLPAKLSEQPKRSGFKANIRIAGGSLTFATKTCELAYHSSAVKIVARESLIGLQVDEMKLLGPNIDDREEPSILVRLRNTSVKYLLHPEEQDLDRMIGMLTPSQDKFGEEDDFLSDTLIRQRKKGAALRLYVAKAEMSVSDFAAFDRLQEFANEVGRLSVTKYLPQESRPGLLTLGLLQDVSCRLDNVPSIGYVSCSLSGADFAHVGAPLLFAMRVDRMSSFDKEDHAILRPVVRSSSTSQPPQIRARFIGDELEPVFRVKLWNTCLEYSVALVMRLAGHSDEDNQETASSTTILTGQTQSKASLASQSTAQQSIASLSTSTPQLALDVSLRDCAIGLSPLDLPSKAIFLLTSTQINVRPQRKSLTINLDFKKASLHLIDNVEKLKSGEQESQILHKDSRVPDLLASFKEQGFVPMVWISVASIITKVTHSDETSPNRIDVEFQDELFVLESCADSTQTLIELLGKLQPPQPPSPGQKYRTEVTSIEDMMASFTGDAYATAGPIEPLESSEHFSIAPDADIVEENDDDFGLDLNDLGDLTGLEMDFESDAVGDSVVINPTHFTTDERATQSTDLDESIIVGAVPAMPEILPPPGEGIASKWDSANNRYIHVPSTELTNCPLNLRVRDVHIIWNLFDGYDWEHTREIISNAVNDVEKKAEERRAARKTSRAEEEDQESVIGDFLFNSIYIGVPVNHDPRELRQQINRNVDDMMSETGSQATTVTTRPLSSQGQQRPRQKRLRLERSKRHKIAFEIRGLSVDMFSFPPGEETQSSIDVRVKDFEIFDHVPTSTWKKFATYMQDAGPREDKKPMLHIEICDVRPVPELTASELVLRVTVLPLRLHIDQDALDFLTRFFEFKTDAAQAAPSSPKEQPYLQRVEVLPVPVVLDYKPKKIDFAGLRSGRTTEFMNFFILDSARMKLKHAIIYGCSSPDKLHKALEDVWMPDIRRNQLPSVLSGLNGVRTIVNVGAGVRDLVVVPIQEYRKDGRIVRSVGKGAVAFARGAGGELTRFGAKLAVGAQGFLQTAEDFLVQRPGESATPEAGITDWEDASAGLTEKRAISAYASQPTGILQGLKGAARSLERDLLLTRDVVIAVSGEVRDGGGLGAIARGAPTLVLRPMIGVSKAVGQTLMGATNSVDPESRRRLEDKYKRY